MFGNNPLQVIEIREQPCRIIPFLFSLYQRSRCKRGVVGLGYPHWQTHRPENRFHTDTQKNDENLQDCLIGYRYKAYKKTKPKL